MFAMRARVWLRSVKIPACAPVSEIAVPPSSFTAIAVRAAAACSPVESRMSSSRLIGGDRLQFFQLPDNCIGVFQAMPSDGAHDPARVPNFLERVRGIL